MTLRIMTLSIESLFVTINISDTLYRVPLCLESSINLVMMNVIMLSVMVTHAGLMSGRKTLRLLLLFSHSNRLWH